MTAQMYFDHLNPGSLMLAPLRLIDYFDVNGPTTPEVTQPFALKKIDAGISITGLPDKKKSPRLTSQSG